MVDERALEAAQLALERVLVERRDHRARVTGQPLSGFAIKETDGTDMPIMRLGTRDGLRIAILAYEKALEVSGAERG